MSGNQKILQIFGTLEIISAVLNAIGFFMGMGTSLVLSAIVSALTAYLLLTAAKDATKIKPAWSILLLAVVLSAAEVFFSLNDGASAIIGAVIPLALNCVAFIAANNIKKQMNL